MPDPLAALLETGGELVLDTNAVYGRTLLRLAGAVQRVNAGRPPERRLRLVLPTLVYAERQAQERARRTADFDPEVVRVALEDMGFGPDGDHRFEPFDLPQAEAHADRVGRGDWQARKARALAQALRVPVPDPPPRVPATVDWFIGAHALARGRVLISNDEGAEHTLEDLRRVRVDALEAALGLG
jgi:hypothetical protein